MSANKTVYVCTSCGSTAPRWFGRCPECGEWNTLVEEITEKRSSKSAPVSPDAAKSRKLSDIEINSEIRYTTGISELDSVLGGGLVKGSVVLLGGEPGAGKSTLLLQVAGLVGDEANVLYVSGEESASQIKLRANRLGVRSNRIDVVTETDVDLINAVIKTKKPDLVIIDSIQTMCLAEISSAPGSVTQVRESTSSLLRTAKSEDIPMFIVGHVNKDGAIAGPKVMEHIVDTVLHFEGDKYLPYRMLRAVKNRFGSTNEIGIFEMTSEGLSGVQNPSLMLLDGRAADTPGSCVTCIMEGTRPILAEIQSLVAKSGFGNARRTASGMDYNRVSLLLAVLEKRGGYFLSSLDVYLNVVGGLEIDEPSADLAVAASVVSALTDKPIPDGTVAFGEIGLGGEVRGVSNAELRAAEAAKLGFTRCVLANSNIKKMKDTSCGIELIGISNIGELTKVFEDEKRV